MGFPLRLAGAIGFLLALAWPVPLQASGELQSATTAACTVYVDNQASSNGNGAVNSPWNRIPDPLNLPPGQTLCLRGDASGPGRIYATETLHLTANGSASRPITLRGYPGEKVILRTPSGAGGVISIEGDYWTVAELILDNNGNTNPAVRVDAGAAYAVVLLNEIRNGYYNGVELRGTHTTLAYNHIHHFDGVTVDAECIIVYMSAAHNLIQGNTVHDCSGNGLELYKPNGLTIDPRDTATSIVIDGNTMYRGTLTRAESGIGLKMGYDITITNNDLSGYRDSPTLGVSRGVRNVLIEGNRIHDTERGINLFRNYDETPEQITVRNNWIYNITSPTHGNGINIVGVDTLAVVHNTFSNVALHAINIAGAGATGATVANNLAYASGSGRIAPGSVSQPGVIGYNAWFDTPTDFPSPTDVTGSGNPGFVDAAGRDFHLRSDSLVLDAGGGLGVLDDIDGDPRPSGCCPDLGADEALPALRLSVWPQDGALRLMWNELYDPNVASFAVIYSRPPGAANAAEGASPILNLPPDTRVLTLTGLTNFVPYSVQVVARDASNADLFTSNELILSPTDLAAFLPAAWRPTR